MTISRTSEALQVLLGKLCFKNHLPTTKVTTAYASCTDDMLLSKAQVKEVASPLPAVPTTNGNYSLKLTVSSTGAAYTWETLG